jgi:hypothetical protein
MLAEMSNQEVLDVMSTISKKQTLQSDVISALYPYHNLLTGILSLMGVISDSATICLILVKAFILSINELEASDPFRMSVISKVNTALKDENAFSNLVAEFTQNFTDITNEVSLQPFNYKYAGKFLEALTTINSINTIVAGKYNVEV